MLDHGLDAPAIQLNTQPPGYFVLTFPGPDGNYNWLEDCPANTTGFVTPAIEAQLNKRQKQIMRRVIEAGSVNRRWCVTRFKVANDTAGRDLKFLTIRLSVSQGKARAVRYVLADLANRPTIY